LLLIAKVATSGGQTVTQEEAVSKAKQSRSEKKARKALSKLGQSVCCCDHFWRDRFNGYKKFELMLTRRAKAYSSFSSVVTHRSNKRAQRRVTSFQSKRVTNYATPPTQYRGATL